ncbi:hypothetical protein DFH08DRAFT_947834 [Mycena albidolilacea]|uniref:Zn(2)-C6 fungal-type domain-containing protein n=1 Tax=Mycena albidolilacea TaxID=1033008 RepID=A0AAD7F6X4_9AGAR|nr:hypothetical protein DFH08DRAFT_947834 [Mycena albidolilacea]
MSSDGSQHSRNNCISREPTPDLTEEKIARMEAGIEEQWEAIVEGMSREAVERADADPDYLRYLRELIKLEGEAEAEVETADTNLRVAEGDMLDATTRHDQVAELRQRFQQGKVKEDDFVDAVDLLRRACSPDVDEVPDEKLGPEDESDGGEEPEEPEEVGKKRKGKGKAKVTLKRVRREHEEQDSSSDRCERCEDRNIRCIVLPGKTACDSCHNMHVKCSLRPQSKTRMPQVKGPRIAKAMAELGREREDAVAHRPVSQVSSQHHQVNFQTGELLPNKMPSWDELRLGLINTQHRLRELEQREKEHKLKKQRKQAAQAAQAAGIEPQEAVEPPHSEMTTGRTGRSSSRAARPLSRAARLRSHTGVDLLSSDVPKVPPVNMSGLIPMVVKEEHQEANSLALDTIMEWGLERLAWKAERREQITREEAEKAEKAREEKERQKAKMEAQLKTLKAQKAKLEESKELKMELVEEAAASSFEEMAASSFLSDFVAPIGWHLEGGILVEDDEVPEAIKNIDYELEYK